MKMVSWMWKKNVPKEEEEVDEDELKKKGFNPEGLDLEQAKDEPIIDFDKDYEGFICPSEEQTKDQIALYKFFPNDDEHRHELAYSKGGKICGDKGHVSKIRSIGKEMIKLIGKKIITGDLNLTRISFPIKAMVPKTALQNSTLSCCMLPYFMKRACESKDPVERMKYVITNTISAFYYMNLFLKPLNPVLGETLQAKYPDGTLVYCEQVSHHPPVSYFLAVGPQNSYRYYGSYNFSAVAGLNSMTLTNKGIKTYDFADGMKITATFNKQIYSGVFMGTLRSEATETIYFNDEGNKIKAEISFGKIKKKPSDYFQGVITRNGKPASKFDGSYCGFINFDGVRYWDGRYLKAFKIVLEEKPLASDYRNRADLQRLKEGNLDQAQKQKQVIEQAQRKDVKLRQQFAHKK